MPSTTCVGGEYTYGIVHLDIHKIFHTDSPVLRLKGYDHMEVQLSVFLNNHNTSAPQSHLSRQRP